MSDKVIGKCHICKKEVTEHDITFVAEGQFSPVARYCADWPGDGVLCYDHPGVPKLWEERIHGKNAKH